MTPAAAGWPTRRAFLAASGALAVVGPTASAAPPLARPQGVALGLFASDPMWDYGPLLDEIAALGASEVMLVVPLYLDDIHATVLTRRPGSSPAPATVERTLVQCRDRGLRIALMPLARLSRRTPTEWRGVLAPADVDAWFAAWGRVVADHADLAARHSADRLVVGTEFASLEVHEARWRALIAAQRRRFAGRLVYSANWDNYATLPFWDAVDDIGVTGYFRLVADHVRPDAAAVQAVWESLVDRLSAFAAARGKPVLLTEVGWPALASAASHPWDDARGTVPDPILQATIWSGFLGAVRSRKGPGFYAWNWFGLAGPVETGHGLRGQPAAEVLRAHLREVATSRLR